MQAVILAAGKGTRMHPLTLSKPKQLIEANGKPIIEHIISALPEEITEVIMVIGYKGDMIMEHCGEEFCGRKMQYVWQHEPLGTAHALEQAKHLLHGSFLVMYGDDLVDGATIKKALQHKSCLLAYEHPDPRAFGVIELKDDGTLKTIVEKPEKPTTNLVSASGLVLHTDLFNHYEEWPETGERYITHALNRYAQDNPVHIEQLSFWYPVNSLEQLEEAERMLKK
jgi:UDP-N-acetylglucosamine diphosphorylase / glucose-1-phosphate thymidylyltransferase / UDP-N-acetylgalactosamine diphosphorylase / glucosamine-1-phosphate N-acetyltransferase / galactosamine-1-phosphate N-acetyltransferase